MHEAAGRDGKLIQEPHADSEVARLLDTTQHEYEAAQQGLSGLAQGTARHQVIDARMKRMHQTHKQLEALVGPDEARTLIAHTVWTSEDMGISAT
jgi:hypothetical protein